MDLPTSHSDGALASADVVRDANPGANTFKYRSLLKEIDNGLGVKDMEKLKYLCQDLGVAPRKLEGMNRGIYLFVELEKLALITADDISLLVLLMQAINRYDLVKKLKAWSSKEGNLAHRLSAYRRLMLRISDSLSRDEKVQFVFYLSGGNTPLPVADIEESKSLLQLFMLMEKYTLIGPGDLDFFTNIMQSIGNVAIVKEIEKYLANESLSVHSLPPSTSPGFEGAGVAYNTGNRRSNSAPSFETYAQSPSSYGQSYHQHYHHSAQPYHHPQQPYHQPQQPASTSFSHQLWQSQQYLQSQRHLKDEENRQMLLKLSLEQQQQKLQQQQKQPQQQFQQQQAIKGEPEDTSGSETSRLAFSPERPRWYFEAVQKYGTDQADEMWEKLVQREEQIREKMKELKIAEERITERSASSIKTESSDEGDSQPSQTPTDEGHRIVPAQTASVRPPSNRDESRPPELPKYLMNRVPRGICLIFNAENFPKHTNLDKREGTQRDVSGLVNTFEKNLKFEIKIKNDPKSQEYFAVLGQFQQMDHSDYDCFVCIILSHGSKGCVYGVDGLPVQIDDLTGMFKGVYVPTLADKPKLFFIQACQGKEVQEPVDIQEDSKPSSLPNDADILVSLSTVPGYASNRSISQGTWFIATLCRTIDTYYKNVDLLSMLTMVNELLSKAADKEKKKQIGYPSHTLRKQIFFNRGLEK